MYPMSTYIWTECVEMKGLCPYNEKVNVKKKNILFQFSIHQECINFIWFFVRKCINFALTSLDASIEKGTIWKFVWLLNKSLCGERARHWTNERTNKWNRVQWSACCTLFGGTLLSTRDACYFTTKRIKKMKTAGSFLLLLFLFKSCLHQYTAHPQLKCYDMLSKFDCVLTFP